MRTILLVDDEATVHDVLHEVLSSDYHIIDAFDGKKALKKMRDHREQIDLVLLDMNMPDKSGLEVLEELAGLEGGGIPIVMLTSVDENEVESVCIEAGAIDYIKKPLNVKVLKARIAAHIAFSKSASRSEIERLVQDRAKMAALIADDTLKMIKDSAENQFESALVTALMQLRDTVRVLYP